jgi:hypothetical protein
MYLGSRSVIIPYAYLALTQLIFYNFENDIDEPLGTDVTEPTPTSDPIDLPLLTSPDELHQTYVTVTVRRLLSHFTSSAM